MNYKGVIIEESLIDPSILKEITILDTKVSPIEQEHKTPWLKQWTEHTVEIPEDKAQEFAQRVQNAIDTTHQAWYADFKNDKTHFIIFPERIFKIDRTNESQYEEARAYGISLGIPEYQLDFSPQVVV